MNQLAQVIGLTGGVASGKSLVAAHLLGQGIPVINLDMIGREITTHRSELWDRLIEICGPEIISENRLNRALMREKLFADENVRQQVEALLHPPIWAEFLWRCSQLKGHKLAVCEAALLVEGGLHSEFEELVVVSSTPEIRKMRLIKRDQIKASLAEQMIAAQLADAVRSAHATVLIKNDGSEADLRAQADALIKRWHDKGWL